jgi:GNAT superfamily N-acetyltransferase
MRPGQEALWLGLDLTPGEVEASLPDLEERVRRRPDERSFLLAFRGARCVGRLEGTFVTPRVYVLREVYAADVIRAGEIQRALCWHLRPSFAGDGVTVMTWDAKESEALNGALARSGFRVTKRKVLVERSVTGYRSPYVDALEYRSLDAAGRAEFVRALAAAAEGDPFEDRPDRDPEREFQELVDYAGERFDPAAWMVASLDDETVGVVLPQVFAGRGDEGTLFYVGVVPPFRGRGYGRVLHATGLESLARRGVTKYVGSTDERNAAMLAVFAANGCVRTGIQLFHTATQG